MKIGIHAGHNRNGFTSCGAIGYIDESKEARDLVKIMLAENRKRDNGVVLVDCTINKQGLNKSQVLNQICNKTNKSGCDLAVSIHFNACRMEFENGKNKGIEVWTYDKHNKVMNCAKGIVNNVGKIGFTKRGVKQSKGLYFLKHTKAKALLIEVCFCDDADDVKIYKANKERVAIAILDAISKY